MSEIAEFITREAALLDDRRYEEWVALFMPDALYWAPVSPDMTSPRDGPSHFRDDVQIMKVRTHRLANPRAFAAEPSPRTVHIVSGVHVEGEDGDDIMVSSSQIMLEYRNRGRFEEDQRLFGGRIRHRLRRTADGLRIVEKRVDLINAEGAFNAIAAPI